MLQRVKVLDADSEFDGGALAPGCIKNVKFVQPLKIHLQARGHPLRLNENSHVGEVLQVGVDSAKSEVYVMASLFGAGATFFARRERQAKFRVVGDFKATTKRLWYAPWKRIKLIESIQVHAVIMEVNTDEAINERVHRGRTNSHAKGNQSN